MDLICLNLLNQQILLRRGLTPRRTCLDRGLSDQVLLFHWTQVLNRIPQLTAFLFGCQQIPNWDVRFGLELLFALARSVLGVAGEQAADPGLAASREPVLLGRFRHLGFRTHLLVALN